MKDERDSIEDEEGAAAPGVSRGDAATRPRTPRRYLPEPLETAGFALQERILWPLQDRFSSLGPGHDRELLGGGALAVIVAGVAVAIALSAGGGTSQTTSTVAVTPPPQSEPPVEAASEPTAKKEPPAPTLHGAAPVFSPPSSASKGGGKAGGSEAAASTPSSESASSTPTNPSPASATISSAPGSSSSSTATDAAKPGAGASTSAVRASLPDGPPAGPAALKVARRFAQGFVVYETGGEEAAFKRAFEASATPELAKALLQRPPRQPAGVEVPRAKVLNVVAGPSQGKVYKVSVSLLRVGVTSELRLDMEKPKNAKWRVTNVLG